MPGPRNGPTYGDLYGHEPGYAVHGFLALQQAISESIAASFTPTTNNAQVGCACVCIISVCLPVCLTSDFCLPASMFLTIQIIHNMQVQRFPFPRKTTILL